MNSQMLILVDKNDRKVGYGTLEETHIGYGKHHRAFVTVLFNSRNRVLLQRRRHKLFDGLWDLTAISHPLVVDGKVETYQEASDRALNKEMGIGHVQIKKIGGFNYFAKDGANCENEYCAILIGRYDGEIKENRNQVYETRRMSFSELADNVKKSPKVYTPWAVKAVEIVKKYNGK